MSTIIARGAEAVIRKKDHIILKERIRKGYRHQQLDEKLRKLRTRQEARLLEKANKLINAPQVISIDETSKIIELQIVEGKKLAQSLDTIKNVASTAKKIGNAIAKIHDAEIIHGDLTTSNMIAKENKVYFIDFGLGFHSSRIEDKAVDLHVLKEALEARHPKVWQKTWKAILTGYKMSKHATNVLKQLEKVEQRGRYKAQY